MFRGVSVGSKCDILVLQLSESIGSVLQEAKSQQQRPEYCAKRKSVTIMENSEKPYFIIREVSGFNELRLTKLVEFNNNDTALMGEISDINSHQFYPGKLVISPENRLKICFDILISFLEFIEIFFVSYVLSFNQPNILVPQIFMPLFIINIVLSFFKGYVQDIRVISELRLTSLKYLKTRFFLDVVATAPFFYINQELLAIRLLRIFRFSDIISSMVNLVTIIISACKVLNKKTKELINTSVRVVLFLSLILHLSACCLKLISEFDETGNWICQSVHLFPGHDTHSYTPGLCEDHLLTKREMYIACLYIIMMSFSAVGYGDYSVKTVDEIIFMIFVLLLGIGFFGYLMGRVNRVVSLINTRNRIKIQRSQKLETFLLRLDRANRQRPLNSSFIECIWSHFDNYWTKNHRTLHKSQYFYKIPPQIQDQVSFCYLQMVTYLFSDFFYQFRFFFEDTEESFRKEIAKNVRFTTFQKQGKFSFRFPKRTYSIFRSDHDYVAPIFNKGEIPGSFLLIISGSLQLCSGSGGYKYLRLNKGSFFGEGYILFDTPCSYSVYHKINDIVQVYEIEAELFKKICYAYPKSLKVIKERAMKRREKFREKKIIWLKELQLKLEQSLSTINTSLSRITAYHRSLEMAQKPVQMDIDNLVDHKPNRNSIFSSFRRNSKKKKKRGKDEEKFGEKEGERFRKRKKYLENNLQDPEIAEEMSYNSEDEYNTSSICHWIQFNSKEEEVEPLLSHSRQIIDVQRQIDLIEIRMKYFQQRMERELGEAIMMTNLGKRSSTEVSKRKESPQRRNTFAYFNKSVRQSNNRKNSDNNQHW